MKRGRSRPLAILGGFGAVNSGDEMILRAVVRQARAVGYAGRINVICGRTPPPESARQDYESMGLRPVSWRNIAAAARAVMGRDLFIGGGQVIDGVAGVQYPCVQLGLAAIAVATGGEVSIGGVSTARLQSAAVRCVYGGLFRCARRIRTRDEGSTREIVSITPSAAAKTETLSDLVFGLASELGGSPPGAERNIVAFAVHSTPTLKLTDFDTASEILRRILALAQHSHQVRIVAHDMRADWDIGLAERLCAELANPRASVQLLSTTQACASFYGQVRSVISARMHPIIVGACAGAYCVPLAGSRKVADIAEKLGIRQWRAEELAEADDETFAGAIGLVSEGPRVDEERVNLLSDQARRVLA